MVNFFLKTYKNNFYRRSVGTSASDDSPLISSDLLQLLVERWVHEVGEVLGHIIVRLAQQVQHEAGVARAIPLDLSRQK